MHRRTTSSKKLAETDHSHESAHADFFEKRRVIGDITFPGPIGKTTGRPEVEMYFLAQPPFGPKCPKE